jgi:hypothetical protein
MRRWQLDDFILIYRSRLFYNIKSKPTSFSFFFFSYHRRNVLRDRYFWDYGIGKKSSRRWPGTLDLLLRIKKDPNVIECLQFYQS